MFASQNKPHVAVARAGPGAALPLVCCAGPPRYDGAQDDHDVGGGVLVFEVPRGEGGAVRPLPGPGKPLYPCNCAALTCEFLLSCTVATFGSNSSFEHI